MTTIISIGLAQALFSSLVLITEKNKKIADKILICWLLLMALNFGFILYRLCFQNDFLIDVVTILAHGPLCYLYAEALMKGSTKFKRKKLLHLVPFVIFLIAFSILELIKGVGWFHSFLKTDQKQFPLLWFSFTSCIFLVFIIYFWKLFFLVKKHRRKIRNHFSYESEQINLHWILGIATFMFLGYSTLFLGEVIYKISGNYIYPLFIFHISLTCIAYGVSYFGIKQPSIFGPTKNKKHIIPILPEKASVLYEEEKTIIIETPKYAKSGLTTQNAAKLKERVLDYMHQEKPFLKGDLTIQDIANHMNTPRHYLTQVINEQLNKNFYSFINDFRIEEFKLQITKPENNNLTILAIAFNCGFNSKSTFNNYFKQSTGMTPTQFKKQQKELSLHN
ncbi:MAG: helix-turn-helix domain-containing protein [Bacteroidales bacterium]